MASSSKSRGLGRGLDALIQGGGVRSTPPPAPAAPVPQKKKSTAGPKKTVLKPVKKAAPPPKTVAGPAPVAPVAPDKPAANGIRVIAVSQIARSPWQPRREFVQEALEDLASSIKERGVLQPLLVRQLPTGKFELIAGERRFRAAQLAGKTDVPVIVQEATDRDALELALVENIQREDLNLIEEAEGYHLLAKTFTLTQEEVAKRVGKARATITNALRLLDLSDAIKRAIAENTLSAGHAKVLLGVEPERRDLLAARVIAQGLSVRALEQLIRTAPKAAPKKPAAAPEAPANDRSARHLKHIADRMQQELGTKVQLAPARILADGRKEAGRILIEFYDNDDLSRLLEALNLADLD